MAVKVSTAENWGVDFFTMEAAEIPAVLNAASDYIEAYSKGARVEDIRFAVNTNHRHEGEPVISVRVVMIRNSEAKANGNGLQWNGTEVANWARGKGVISE